MSAGKDGREWHVCLPSVSAEDRGKERVGVAGRAQSVTMERGEEGLSPYSQNERHEMSFKTKASLQGLKTKYPQ